MPMITWALCTDPLIFFDISRWQGLDIPFEAAADLGVEGVIIKGFHGASRTDSFHRQLQQAETCDRLVFIDEYGWALPGSDLQKQVGAWTSSEVATISRATRFTIDWEDPDTGLRGLPLIARGEYLIEAFSDKRGHRPIIYTGKWYIDGYCEGEKYDSEIFASCPLHLAAYPRKHADGTRYREAVAEVCGGVQPGVPSWWRNRGVEPLGWQLDGDKGLYLPKLPNGSQPDVDVNIASRRAIMSLLGRTTPMPSSAPDTIPAGPEGVRRKSSQRVPVVDAEIIDEETGVAVPRPPSAPVRPGPGEKTYDPDDNA